MRPATPGNLPFVTFHLDPATVVANVGETFITRTGLINNDRLIIDAVRIALSYPPTIMRPVAIDDAELRRLLRGDPDVRLDTVSGHIVYEGELAKPTVGAELALIAIEWEALRPAQQAPIRTSVDNAHSGALQEGRLISTTSLGPQNAQLGTSVRIRPAETGLPDGMEFYRETVQTFEPEIFDASREASRLPRLWIDQPSEGTFQPGDYLVIDLGISNPDGLPIDEIRLAGRFDPNAVEILDTDTNNWIVRGTNLLDGPFKSLWPWDLHYNNTVNNQAGIFYYRMGAFNPIVHESAPVAPLFVVSRRRPRHRLSSGSGAPAPGRPAAYRTLCH